MKKHICKDLSIYRKTSRCFELRFHESGRVVDISNWTIYFTAKQNMEDEDTNAVIKKDITIHLDATNGKSLIELTTTDTNLENRSYYYDIKYVDDEDNAGILYHGRLVIREPVTTRG